MINGTKFLFVTSTVKNEFSDHDRDTLLKVYRVENGQRRYLLKHAIHRKGADCNNIYTDKGSYRVEGDKMIFITDFLQQGSDPIPQSWRQVYQVNDKGKMILISDLTTEHDGSVVNNLAR
jgi:hypothetical protein